MNSLPVFHDTHAHLSDEDFRPDLPEVIARAQAAGVGTVVAVSIDFETSRRSLELAERFPGVYAAVGWHPSHALEAPEDLRPVLRELARHPKVVAIGETGLDYYRMPSRQKGGTVEDDDRYRERQIAIFRQQMEVAAECGLNVVVHQRESLADCLREVEPFLDRLRAVYHCFVGDPPVLERVLATGCYVSFTGIITYKTADAVRASAATAPPGRFMLETDSPWLAPVPHRGKRCEPAHTRVVAEEVARVRQCSLEALSEMTMEAVEGFFPKITGGNPAAR